MKRYIFTHCAYDGSTPLDEPLPEVIIEIKDTADPMENYRQAHSEFHKQYPGRDVVSWGLESEIRKLV